MLEPDFLHEAQHYLAILHKRRGLLLTPVVVSLLLATIRDYTTRPIYQATCQILIERKTPDVLPGRQVIDYDKGADFYATQYELIRGRLLAEKVVRRLELEKTAEFQTGPLLTPVERLRRWATGKAIPVQTETREVAPVVDGFRSRLKVLPVEGSRLVHLSFWAYDPLVAARVANALGQLYIEQSLEFRYTASAEATGWLGERVREQQAKLESAEKALQQFREREGLLNFEERQGLVDRKLETLSTALVGVKTERIAKESLLRQMQSLPSSQLETFPLVLENATVQGLRSRLAEMREEQARLSEVVGQKHPEWVKLESRIRAAQDEMRAQMRDVIRSVENAYLSLRQQEDSLAAEVEAANREALAVSRKAIGYGALKREIDSGQQLLKELLGRTKETGVESELRTSNVRIVEKAEVPRRPIRPQRTRNLGLAFLLGVAAGVALCFLFEHLDNTLKTPEDIKIHLGLPFLGMIPEIRFEPIPAEAISIPMVVRKPQSAEAEAFRVLRTNLIFSTPDTAGRAVVVSSANPGEGKTTAVANLASSLAVNGARVLAMEADLRRPALHQLLGGPKAPGLTNLIVGNASLDEAIVTTTTPGLSLLPCGYVPPNPAELLGSASLRELLGALRQRFDWILVDSPPIVAMADTPVLCPVVDGVVLVVWAEICSRPAAQRAADQITRVGGKILGVVLNKVNLARNAYYYSQYYGDYYRGYYGDKEPSDQSRASAGS